jgi:hypothetical protein
MTRPGKSARAIAATALMLWPATAGSAAGKSKNEKYPYAWGVLEGNTGCVIFADTRHKKTEFVGVIKESWWGTLDVIETHHYEMKQKQWQETRKSLDQLQKLALEAKLKLVKIPAKHTQEQLEEARKMCGVPAIPSGEPK